MLFRYNTTIRGQGLLYFKYKIEFSVIKYILTTIKIKNRNKNNVQLTRITLYIYTLYSLQLN